VNISRQIRSFVHFAIVTLAGFGGVWVCWQLRFPLYINLWLMAAVCLAILVGVLGMTCSLIAGLISGIVACFKGKPTALSASSA